MKKDKKIFRGRFGKKIVFIIVVTGLIFCLAAMFEYCSVIWHTSLFTIPYEIRELDISHHQGET